MIDKIEDFRLEREMEKDAAAQAMNFGGDGEEGGELGDGGGSKTETS